jgi:nodulation protein E
MRRVAVTGLGVVSALGHEVSSFWRRLVSGESAIAPTTRTVVDDTVQFPAAQVRDFDPLHHFSASELLIRDPYAQYALVAAREAVADAALVPRRDPEGYAVVLGTGGGGEASREEAAIQLFVERKGRCHPMLVPKTNSQASVGLVCMEHGITGPAFTVSTGCASGTHAICQAFELVRRGAVTAAITGGSEASLLYCVYKAFSAVRVLSTQTCRPFSKGREGMVMGEGAGVLVLEDLEHARARGARIYAELIGGGMSADASDPVHPASAGAAAAMRRALTDAQLDASAVGYVNAHGTGTLINDRVETQAIHEVFGAAARTLAISSTKSMHGHAFGGAGGLEAVATVLALHTGILPPTANYLERDPECDLDYVPNQARERQVEYALSNSFAFGGLNAVVAFRRGTDPARPDLPSARRSA